MEIRDVFRKKFVVASKIKMSNLPTTDITSTYQKSDDGFVNCSPIFLDDLLKILFNWNQPF